MSSITVIVLLGTALAVNSERHSLTYIYSALSKPVDLPGIHEFTAMGLLDDKKIDYFDSTTQKTVPRQTWMKDKLSEDYWGNSTLSHQSKQKWFKVNIDILMKQMRQNDTNLRVLQWMHGCEGEVESDGKFKFLSGINRYGYDGNDFLSFDDTRSVWVASVDEAKEIKKKWDEDQVLKKYTKAYMENECLEWLSKFVDYSKEHLRAGPPPEIYLYAQNAKVETNIVLTCLATGFYPEDIVLNIKRDGRILTRDDGVQSSGVRPNNDETFQRLDHVPILKKDQSRFTCEVDHLESGLHVEKEWNHECIGSGGLGPIIGGAVVLLLLVILVVLLVVFRKRIFGSGGSAGTDSTAGYAPGPNGPLAVITTAAPNGTASQNMTHTNGTRKGSDDSLDSSKSKNSGGSSDSGVGADASSRTPTPETQSLLEKTEGQV